jgi:hypothetical protein
MFDNLDALAPPKPTQVGSELEHYLNADIEHVVDPIAWWYEHRYTYPHLSRMALDYLTVPGKHSSSTRMLLVFELINLVATSVDVERLFSRGRLLLSHVRSRLSAQSTRALLCLGIWSKLNLVKNDDIKAVISLPDIQDGLEMELEDGWDRIIIN